PLGTVIAVRVGRTASWTRAVPTASGRRPATVEGVASVGAPAGAVAGDAGTAGKGAPRRVPRRRGAALVADDAPGAPPSEPGVSVTVASPVAASGPGGGGIPGGRT